MKRREFFAVSAIALQTATQRQGASGQTTFAPMNESAHRSVVKPPKPNAQRSMTAPARDALEHQIKCMCGCSLDVYTCRTTDFTCPISPAMHRDIDTLVAGGYTAAEISDAFVDTYGERVLMAPKREGFNWAGYVVPFVTLAAGATGVTILLKRWTRVPVSAPATAASARTIDASDDELARLAAAVRNDEDGDE